MRALTPLALLQLLGLVVAPALGDDPDLIEIIKKVDQTTAAVKAVSYTAKVWAEGPSSTAQPVIGAMVRAQEAAEGKMPLVWVEGTVSFPGLEASHPLKLIVNEKQAAAYGSQEKICIVGDLPEGEDLVGEALKAVLMREFVLPAPFCDELNADERRYEGKQTVGGVECHVIYVVYKGGVAEARWYFGVEDFLPHRVDRVTLGSDGKVYRALELRDIDVSAKFDEDTFAIRIPEGYERREYTRPTQHDPGLLKIGSEAPDWTLKTPEGKAVTLSKLRGKVVVLDFWATWCGPCMIAMPKMQKLHEHYKDKPVEVIGINTWERSDAAAYIRKNKYTFTHVLRGDQVALSYGVKGIPTVYVIGPKGEVLHATSGFGPSTEKGIAKVINAALADMD